MTESNTKKRQYMALAPLLSLAAIFISPIASTLSPLVVYFIFRNKRPDVGKVALRTADLAFSMQLWIILISLALMMGISINIFTANDARQLMNSATSIILVIFIASLLFAIYKAFNDEACEHIFSFKIAERVFKLLNKKNKN